MFEVTVVYHTHANTMAQPTAVLNHKQKLTCSGETDLHLQFKHHHDAGVVCVNIGCMLPILLRHVLLWYACMCVNSTFTHHHQIKYAPVRHLHALQHHEAPSIASATQMTPQQMP